MLSASDLIEMVSNIRGRPKKKIVSVIGNACHNSLGGRDMRETLAYIIALRKNIHGNLVCDRIELPHIDRHKESNSTKTVPKKQAKAREKL